MAKKRRSAKARPRRGREGAPSIQFVDLVDEIRRLRESIERLNETLRARTAFEASLAPGRLEAAERAIAFPARLLGPSLKERFPFGAWQSHDAQQRWHLDFNDKGCEWIERSASGSVLKRPVALVAAGDRWRIERPNDADVLRFLGASQTAINEILAGRPQASFMNIDFTGDTIAGEWNGLRWILDAQGHLKSLEQPGSTPSTITQYALIRQGDDGQWFKAGKGQLTFDQEGHEGGPFHSRSLHWPGGASGVTMGRGYDMAQRSAVSIRADLAAAGVDAAVAGAISGAAGLTGAAASDFVTQKRRVCGNLSPGQQLRLFNAVYQLLDNDTKRICEKPDVVKKFGKVNFGALDRRIWDVVVDLRFRGDYTPKARDIMQTPVVRNDMASFKSALSDAGNWPNVPQARFNARVSALS